MTVHQNTERWHTDGEAHSRLKAWEAGDDLHVIIEMRNAGVECRHAIRRDELAELVAPFLDAPGTEQ